MINRKDVKEGQRYTQRPRTRNHAVVWKVGAIHASAVPIPHAKLIRMDDPMCIKTISCRTLMDPAFYELVADGDDARL